MIKEWKQKKKLLSKTIFLSIKKSDIPQLDIGL